MSLPVVFSARSGQSSGENSDAKQAQFVRIEEAFDEVQHDCRFQTQFIDQMVLSGGIHFQDFSDSAARYRKAGQLSQPSSNDNDADSLSPLALDV